MIRLELPYPPSLNRYWRKYRDRIVLSAKGKEYRRAVGEILWASGRPKLAGLLKVQGVVHPPDLRKRDLDNTLKAIFDSLQAARLYDDDYQVAWLDIRRAEKRTGGEVYLVIEPVSQEELESGSL
jgi:crossover junction endodeoxyribonuclease RusA